MTDDKSRGQPAELYLSFVIGHLSFVIFELLTLPRPCSEHRHLGTAAEKDV